MAFSNSKSFWPDEFLQDRLLLGRAAQVCDQEAGCAHKRMDGNLVPFVEVQPDCRIHLSARRVQLGDDHRAGPAPSTNTVGLVIKRTVLLSAGCMICIKVDGADTLSDTLTGKLKRKRADDLDAGSAARPRQMARRTQADGGQSFSYSCG